MKINFGNQKGATIVETLLGLGILFAFAATYLGAIDQVKKVTDTSVSKNVSDKELMTIVDSVRANIANYKLNFKDGKAGVASELALTTLPLAWSKYGVTSSEACPTCPGRLGYTIQPLSETPGLYMVTIRLNHASWAEPRDFSFISK